MYRQLLLVRLDDLLNLNFKICSPNSSALNLSTLLTGLDDLEICLGDTGEAAEIPATVESFNLASPACEIVVTLSDPEICLGDTGEAAKVPATVGLKSASPCLVSLVKDTKVVRRVARNLAIIERILNKLSNSFATLAFNFIPCVIEPVSFVDRTIAIGDEE